MVLTKRIIREKYEKGWDCSENARIIASATSLWMIYGGGIFKGILLDAILLNCIVINEAI